MPVFKIGDSVKIANNATYYDGMPIPRGIKAGVSKILSIQGDRATLGQEAIVLKSPVNVSFLTLIEGLQQDEEGETVKRAEEAEAAKKDEEADAVKRAEEAEAAKKAEEVEAVKRAEEAEAAKKAEEAEAAEAVKRAEEAEAVKRAEEAKAAEAAKKVEEATKVYAVTIAVSALNVRKGPGLDYKVSRTFVNNKDVHNIVEEVEVFGDKWGKLESGWGWIALMYTRKA